jgi:hypothetical protein
MLDAKTEPPAGRLVKTAARTAVQINPLSANIFSSDPCSCRTVFKKIENKSFEYQGINGQLSPTPAAEIKTTRSTPSARIT